MMRGGVAGATAAPFDPVGSTKRIEIFLPLLVSPKREGAEAEP